MFLDVLQTLDPLLQLLGCWIFGNMLALLACAAEILHSINQMSKWPNDVPVTSAEVEESYSGDKKKF